MKLNRNDYTVEAAAGGGFYAYFNPLAELI